MSTRRKISFKIGITGNICAGKTTVRLALQRLGVNTLDAEEAAMNLLVDNPTRLSIRLSDHFGGEVLDNRGRLSRKALMRILYANPDKKTFFDQNLSPVIREEMKRFLYGSVGSYIRAVETPSLLEDDTGHLFDEIWVVTTSTSLQVERLCARNGLTAAQARHLADSQWSQDRKAAQSHRVIDNSLDIHQTEVQVRELLDEIKHKLQRASW